MILNPTLGKGSNVRASETPTFLSAADVKRRYGGVSDMWLHRRLRFDNFPQPVRLAGGGPRSRRMWRLADLEAWEAGRIKRAGAAA